MPATHKSTVYKTVEIKNPFREGQDKAFADILLDKMKETKRWRLTAFGSLLLFLTSLIIHFYDISRQRTVPVLVNVMPSGETQFLGEVRQGEVTEVPEGAIVFQVRKFITNLRSISIDHQVLYNNIDECYSMITNTYEPVMTRMLTSSSPFNLVGRVRRSINIETIIKITANTYQADWIETSIEGTQQRNVRMRALITTALLPVTDETIRGNPLGIYIDNCEMVEL